MANNDSIKQAINLKNLGVNITSSKDLKEEFKTQANGAPMISRCLRDIPCRTYKIYVMTYTIATRAETDGTKDLKSSKMRTLKSTADCIIQHRKNIGYVREQYVPDIVLLTRQRC